ncbi:MAG: YcxB family protein [Pseudomonadota bacterium]
MKATYRISEQDYVNAVKLFAKLTSRLFLVYAASTLALIALAAFGPPVIKAGAIGGLVGGFVVTLVGRYILSPVLARRHYRKYKAIHEEFTIELLNDGVRLSSPDADGKLTWNKMLKWRENENYILIYPMPRLFHIVPKSIASNGFDLKGLTDGLLQHIGKPV